MSLTVIYQGSHYIGYDNGDGDNLAASASIGTASIALTPDLGINVADPSIDAGGNAADTAHLLTASDGANADGATGLVWSSIAFLDAQASASDASYYLPGTSPANIFAGVIPATMPAGNPDTASGSGFSNATSPADILTGATLAAVPAGNSNTAGAIPATISPDNLPPLSLTYQGFNYVDFYNGIYDTANLTSPTTGLGAVAATGANSVAMTPDFGFDIAASSAYAGGATTDTVTDLTAAIEDSTAAGMSSFVRPLVNFLYPQASTAFTNNYYVPNSFVSLFDPGGTGSTTIAYNPATNTTYAGDTPSGTTPATVPAGTPDGNLVNYRGELESTDIGGDLNAAAFFGSPTTAGSYDNMIVNEAEAAAAAGATLFSVGTELELAGHRYQPYGGLGYPDRRRAHRRTGPRIDLFRQLGFGGPGHLLEQAGLCRHRRLCTVVEHNPDLG